MSVVAEHHHLIACSTFCIVYSLLMNRFSVLDATKCLK